MSQRVLLAWREEAERGEEPSATLFARIDQAEAEAVDGMVTQVRAGDTRRAGVVLELAGRRFRDDLGRVPSDAATTVNVHLSTELSGVPLAELEALLARVRPREVVEADVVPAQVETREADKE